MEPRHIVAMARRRGLHGIAVTDHNTIQGGLDAASANHAVDFLVVVGAEIQTEVGDILGLFLHKEIRSRNANQVIDEIRDQNGVVILPHPFAHHKDLKPELLRRFDAVEIINGRDKHEMAERIQREVAFPYSLTVMGNSDAHLYWEIGQASNEIDMERLCLDDLRNALLAGHCHPARNRRRSHVAVYSSKIVKRIRRLT